MQDFIFKRKEKALRIAGSTSTPIINKDDNTQTQTANQPLLDAHRRLSTASTVVSHGHSTLSPLILPAFSPSTFFGRGTVLEEIGKALHDDHTNGLRSYCVYGVGGVGKTQTALKFAHTNYTTYDAIFWIRAGTKEKIDQDIDSIVRKGYAEGSAANPQQVREAFMTWLCCHSNWLLILDNMDDSNLLRDYWPPSQTGAVLITSRNPNIVHITRHGKDIPPFSIKEGATFILDRVSNSSGTRDEAETVSRLLGGLPIALCHLVGYLHATASTLGEFLAIPEISALSFYLLESHLDDVTTFNYELSFHTVFDRSLDTLRRPECREAIELLEIMVLFDPDSISESWFKTAVVGVGGDTTVPQWLRQRGSFKDQVKYNHAIELLRQRSLASKDLNTKTLGVHRMVGWAFRRTWNEADWQRAFLRAQSILISSFPKQIKGRTLCSGEDLVKCRGAATHVYSLELRYREAREAAMGLYAGLEFAELLAHCGYYFYERGQLDNAWNLLQSAREICDREVGDEHNLIHALVLNNIAVIHSLLNQIPQALELNRQVAATREKLLKPDAEELVNIFNNIATNYYDLDQLEEADKYFLKALEISHNIKPVDKFNLGTLLTNAGRNYTRLDRFEEAEKFLLDALAMHLSCIGEYHYFTSATLFRLCQLRMRQGNLEDAQKYIDRCLESRRQAIGAQDFRYAVAEHKKATLLLRQNRMDEILDPLSAAIKTFRLNVGRCEQGLIVRSMFLKAIVLELKQRYDDASILRKEASELKEGLGDSLRSLPCNTPDEIDLLVQADFR